MFRKSVFIMLLVCLLATVSSAVNIPAEWWIYQLAWEPSAGDANWNNPANWALQGSGPIPDGPDANNRSCVLPNQPGPRIEGNAKSYLLQMNAWDPTPWGWNDVNITVTSTALDVNMGSYIGINSSVDYDSYLGNPILVSRAIFNVYGGTVTTPGPYIDSTNMKGIHIGGGGSNFAMAYGMLNIYGGEVNVPRLELHYGEIGLYGGTLHLNADGNFVLTTDHPEAALNKIKINGGTLIMVGDRLNSDPNLPKLITNGYIVCERGTLGTPTYDAGLNRTTLTADVNYCAWRPVPANLATNVHYKPTGDVCQITLSWSESVLDNPSDVNHDVYFGSTFNLVNTATKLSPAYQGTRYDEKGPDANADPCSWTIKDPNIFLVGRTYYWRIDETNNLNVNKKGLIWRFSVHDGKAYNPKPATDSNGLDASFTLSWTAGDWADSHRVYFSSISPVSTVMTDPLVYRGTQSGTTFDLRTLAPTYTLTVGQTYYWRIVEVNTSYGAIADSVTWAFKPTEYVNIDDFTDSMSTVDVNNNWQVPYTPITPPGATNDCAANGLTGVAGRILMRDSTGKYLRFTYNNKNSAESGTGMTFSEAKRPYIGGVSFTGGGVINPPTKALSIDYRGYAANSAGAYDNMYVAIEDTDGNVAVYLNPDPNAQQVTTWTSWYTVLRDINALGLPSPVNLEKISGFAIGFGDRCTNYYMGSGTGDGDVMFDNIRLYASKCVPEYGPTTDMDNDCDVDISDFDIFADQWLWAAVPEHSITKTVPHKAPVIWYKFNESEGNTVADSGSGSYPADVCQTGDVNWEPTVGRNGSHLGCINLNTLASQNTHVEVPVAAFGFMADANHYYNSGNGGSVSLSVWINADTSVGDRNGNWTSFFTVYDSNWAERTSFSIPIWLGVPRVWFSAQNGPTIWGPLMPVNYFGDRWNHWAAVKDADSNTMLAYCNGTLAGTATGANTPLFTLPVQSIRIGMRGQSWANWGKWSGKVQDFKVYDYALDANEVAYDATDGSGVVGFIPLVAPTNFNLDGGSPEDASQIVNFKDMAIIGQEWLLYNDTPLLYP